MTRVAAPAKIGTMTFTGFPDAAFEFYEGLEVDNSKAYWQDHKAIYETAVKGPLTALLAELEPEFGQAKVFRPHRDVRFSADKSPYKTQQGAFLGTDVGVAGHYLAVDANGLLAGGGFRAHGTDQTKRMRAAVDSPAGAELERLVIDLRAAGFEIAGEQVATTPRGFARDHPRIELLRHKELMALKRFGAPAWVSTTRARSEVEKAWRALGPINAWFAEHVGPSTQIGRPRR